MPNQNGNMYGLTILSPIIDDPKIKISHDTALRMYLENMPRHEHSPFARISATHICRLVVMDDVVFVGSPAREEHLNSKYLGSFHAFSWRSLRTAALRVGYCSLWTSFHGPRFFKDFE